MIVLDSSVYIRAFRESAAEEQLERFLYRRGHRVRLASIVALELRVGARSPRAKESLDAFIAAYRSRGRVLTPSFDATVEAGRVLAALAANERRFSSPRGSLTNDAILATTCREADAMLITANVRDFAAIRRHLRGFSYADTASL